MPKPTKSKLLKSFDALLAGQNLGGDFGADDDGDAGDGTRAALAGGNDSDDSDGSEQVGSVNCVMKILCNFSGMVDRERLKQIVLNAAEVFGLREDWM